MASYPSSTQITVATPSSYNIKQFLISIAIGAGSGFLVAKLTRMFGRTVVAIFGSGVLVAAIAHYYGIIRLSTVASVGEPAVHAARAANRGVVSIGIYDRLWSVIKNNLAISSSFIAGAFYALW
jgi:uncharacterized membrane protein (Fun14 family)